MGEGDNGTHLIDLINKSTSVDKIIDPWYYCMKRQDKGNSSKERVRANSG